MNRLFLPLRVGDAGHGRGEEILDANGLTVANGLPWARDEIVRLVNERAAQHVAVRVVTEYGNRRRYPTDAAQAAALYALTGRRTLSGGDVAALLALGFSISKTEGAGHGAA